MELLEIENDLLENFVAQVLCTHPMGLQDTLRSRKRLFKLHHATELMNICFSQAEQQGLIIQCQPGCKVSVCSACAVSSGSLPAQQRLLHNCFCSSD